MSEPWSRLGARRDELGLTVDGIARELRIPAEHLAALEAGDIASLPEGPYRLGWLRSYSAHLGVDAEPLEAALRDIEAPDTPSVPLSTIRAVAAALALVLFAAVGWQIVTLDTGQPGPEASVPPEPQGPDQRVRLRVERPGHFVVRVDGEIVEDRRFAPGEQVDVAGDRRVEIDLPGAWSARVEYNGAHVVPQGRQDAPRRLVFIDDLEPDGAAGDGGPTPKRTHRDDPPAASP